MVNPDRITTLHLKLVNLLGRAAGVLFLLTGMAFLLGAVVGVGPRMLDLIAGILSATVGVLLLRVKS